MDIGTPLLPEVDTTDAGLAATATYDSRDAESFAIRGLAAGLQYFKSDSSLGADRDWERLEGAVRKNVPVGKMMLWFTAAGGTDLGSALPDDRAFSLGGPQSFPGYSPGEIRAGRYWTLDGSFLWKVADILSILSQKLYGGSSWKAAVSTNASIPCRTDRSTAYRPSLAGGRRLEHSRLAPAGPAARPPIGSHWVPRLVQGRSSINRCSADACAPGIRLWVEFRMLYQELVQEGAQQ